jgi:hypothetical protein
MDGIGQLRHVNDAERASGVPNPNLSHALANGVRVM